MRVEVYTYANFLLGFSVGVGGKTDRVRDESECTSFHQFGYANRERYFVLIRLLKVY